MNTMQSLPKLKVGDGVEIIAPASRCTEKELLELKHRVLNWGLQCIVDEQILGDDLLCANSDAMRLQHLIKALINEQTKAIICVRGGYGSMRLIPGLHKVKPPSKAKIFVGMSDITAINLYLQQHWKWPVIHGAAGNKFSLESVNLLKDMMFATVPKFRFTGIAYNEKATVPKMIEANLIGGNLSLIQNSIGTLWQIDARNQILFLEEVGERAYRIDRMLEHLQQAGFFNGILGLVFADFIGGYEPNGTSLIEPVLRRFASTAPFPVIKISGSGHGHVNFPVIFGHLSRISLGLHPYLETMRT